MARHFGLHTLEDPTFAGGDSFRMFVSTDARKLRSVAKAINQADATDDEDNIEAAEGALEHLGWKRSIVEKPNFYRVTIQQAHRRP